MPICHGHSQGMGAVPTIPSPLDLLPPTQNSATVPQPHRVPSASGHYSQLRMTGLGSRKAGTHTLRAQLGPRQIKAGRASGSARPAPVLEEEAAQLRPEQCGARVLDEDWTLGCQARLCSLLQGPMPGGLGLLSEDP